MRHIRELLAGAVCALGISAAPAVAAPGDADALAALVAHRAASEARTGAMHFRLTNPQGAQREREAVIAHARVSDAERIMIAFTAPAMIADTAFLSLNHDTRADENWLYLPATGRERRIPVSERGDAFMGTDLSYGDVKDNFKFGLEDWVFGHGGQEIRAGAPHPVLTGVARTPELAREMGYGAFRAVIDTATAFPLFVEYTDPDGKPLKVVEVLHIGKVGAVDTALRFSVRNLQTGHLTEVWFEDMRAVASLDDRVFDPRGLADGAPDLG